MYTLYVLLCADNTLYTGITNNLGARLKKHDSGEGAKYVRSRLPFKLVYTEELPDRSTAQKREYEVKSWSRALKIKNLGLEVSS